MKQKVYKILIQNTQLGRVVPSSLSNEIINIYFINIHNFVSHTRTRIILHIFNSNKYFIPTGYYTITFKPLIL